MDREGLRALSGGGPDAVRIESLARELGVSKGGFYGYFEDRRVLLEEMLDAWERRSTEGVIERVELEGGDAIARGRRAAALTFSDELLSIDLAVRDWSRRSPGACNAWTTPESSTCACEPPFDGSHLVRWPAGTDDRAG